MKKHPIHQNSAAFIRQVFTVAVTGLFTFLASDARAGFAAQGQGVQSIQSGTVANGALFLETKHLWIASTPAKPYVIDTGFILPACDDIVTSRLVMTVWGGTANYICNLTVQINGTNVVNAAPFTFGTTTDANPVFSASQPSAYGAGSGVWLVGLPVPTNMLFRNGASNHVQITVTTPDSFDGRINHAALVAVYQSAALNNTFEYNVAEGSGDIYRTPTGAQVDSRNVPLLLAEHSGATAAKLRALYTYGDLNQNDRLYFNGTQLGGDDLANYSSAVNGLGFGPNLVEFNVLSQLAASNSVRFTVASGEVPDTRETSLRPQLAVLEVTRPAASTAPALDIALNLVIAWPVSADTYQLEFRPSLDSGIWTSVTNAPISLNGQNAVILPRSSAQQYYRLRKID